jgi:hypothetical protein
MTAMRSLGAGIGLILAAAFAGSAQAQPDGITIAVVQSANIDGATGQMVLQPEAPVYSGDRIDTGPVGQAQIRFRDDTKLVVGPNSSMIIDAFVFNDDDSARDISINVVRGAFRFITGNSPKDAYTITTPTATIGVRGTEFDVAVEREGTTRVANFGGVTIVCPRLPSGERDPSQECVEALDPCTLTVVRSTQPAPVRYGGEDIELRNRQLRFYFPFYRDQSGLLADFQVDTDVCVMAELRFPGGAGPSPIGPNPPPPDPIPVPGPPEAPVFIPPPPPSPEFRSHDRPVYNHGPVFRP